VNTVPARRTGLLLAACGVLAAIGSLLPLASKGDEGVTLLYLTKFSPRTLGTDLALTLFIIAPGAVLAGLLVACGRHGAYAPCCMVFGITGIALTILGTVEGMDHIRTFLGGCGTLRFDAADAAPITIGHGALLALAGYGGMITGGLRALR